MHPLHWENHKLNNQTNQSNSKKSAGVNRDITHNLKTAFLDNLQKTLLIEDKKVDGVDMSDFKIPEFESIIVDEFLNKFIISAETGLRDQIDIRLMIKALPNKIMSYSLNNIDLFNFRIFQEALHAY